jgi:hypothetical protein
MRQRLAAPAFSVEQRGYLCDQPAVLGDRREPRVSTLHDVDELDAALSPEDAKLEWRRNRVLRELAREAEEELGYPVCGLALAPDRVCRMPEGHRGNHG